ncbi:Rad52/Rad22 family DNA repair protein [Edaphobacter modestus]|uniref:Rad52/22 family double-strand break repair protein n=1 Tax=Edaphobacter modestus TaxID=388466 RepID=A0A4Q7XYK1_9BACT|nr:Rad52/Rad22 family DNA repair protein [Edaphobacter modestus]RZU29024.1 hypothetical protein BDD14_6616 [Edaphobacter modestus]
MAFEYTQEKIDQLLEKLREPFALKDVQWRVTNKSKDGKKGMVAPYADPRAYGARLNEVFGPAGWSFLLTTETTTGLTRIRSGQTVSTGKVSVTATLEIFGISKKASIGEMWADDDNAYTRAEAQAKKRAASMFGLGEYFYELKSLGSALWVPLDEYDKPTKLPVLPSWALRAEDRQPKSTNSAQRSAQPQPQQQPNQQSEKTTPAQGQVLRPAAGRQNTQMSDEERRFRVDYREAENFLGSALAENIIALLTDKFTTGELQGNKEEVALEKLRYSVGLIAKVRRASADMDLARLDAILEHYNIKDLSSIPTFQTLYFIAMDMEVVPRLEKKAA